LGWQNLPTQVADPVTVHLQARVCRWSRVRFSPELTGCLLTGFIWSLEYAV